MQEQKKKESMVLRGEVIAELRGPDGKIKNRQVFHNLVTDVGDDFAAAAFYTAAYTGWGMKLGSAKALDDSTPKAGATNDIVQFRRLWAAGEGTSATINRVSICDNITDAGEADADGTFAIAVFAAQIAKGADDTLQVTWNVTYLGA